MKDTSQISQVMPYRVEPMQVKFMEQDIPAYFKYRVVTVSGNPAGPRLLKSNPPPYVKSWGPFGTWEEAESLMDLLTCHTKKIEKAKFRRGRKQCT